jgi:catechol 2,3-dioxygenase-like lactoylglutathione lyase family enzyme
MPGKIVHIALKVRDLESSTKFYEEVFGFRQVTTHRGQNSGHVSRHLTDGTIDLALMVYDSEDATGGAIFRRWPMHSPLGRRGRRHQGRGREDQRIWR